MFAVQITLTMRLKLALGHPKFLVRISPAKICANYSSTTFARTTDRSLFAHSATASLNWCLQSVNYKDRHTNITPRQLHLGGAAAQYHRFPDVVDDDAPSVAPCIYLPGSVQVRELWHTNILLLLIAQRYTPTQLDSVGVPRLEWRTFTTITTLQFTVFIPVNYPNLQAILLPLLTRQFIRYLGKFYYSHNTFNRALCNNL